MTDSIALWLGDRLLTGSIQAAVVVALVWLTCRIVPRIPAAAQAALWWLVALKLVLVFAPVPAVPVPLLPADFERQTGQFAVTLSGADDRVSVSPIDTPFRALVLVWLVALLIQTARLVLAHRHLRGVVRRSIQWADDETSELATRLGLKRAPEVRLSGEIDTPQVFGLWSPVVLVPDGVMTTFSDDERRMTLCHELVHVRRRDLALGWIPACAERLFFFHPLARLAAREYVTAREAACDTAAVRALGVAAGDYGRLLIRLGIGNAPTTIAAGGSPFSNSSLKRRLHMLEHHQPSKSSRRWWWIVAVIGAAMIPIQLVARTSDTSKLTKDLSPLGAPPQAHARKVVVTPGREDQKVKLQIEKTVVLHAQREDEVRIVVDKVRQAIEDARQAKETEQLRVKLVEARAALEKEASREDVDKLTLLQLIEMKARELEAPRRQQAAAGQQERIARLAERLEQLAAEHRALAEELERLRRESDAR